MRNCETGFIFQPVHNVFLLVWAEIGVIGFLFSVGLLLRVTCYVLCNSALCDKNNLLNISLIAVIITMAMADHWLWSLHFGVLFFWLMIGLVTVRTTELSEPLIST